MSMQPHIAIDSVSPLVIVCGEPDRVNRIASLLQDAEAISEHREFRIYQGTYRNKLITVCSTGIGAPSTLIALEELILCGAKSIIRVGSAGAIQPNIGLGELVIAEGAVRDDGGSQSYVDNVYPAYADFRLLSRIESFVKTLDRPSHFGVVRSHDSFYRDDELTVCHYWNQYGILAADMETAALLTVGRLRGVQVAAILNNVVLYDHDVKDGIQQYADEDTVMMDGERLAAKAALEALTSL